MARFRPDSEVKARMWAALLKAAKDHHPSVTAIQAQIARDAGVSKASVTEWKAGKSYPEDATLRKLANLYRVPVERIAGYDTDAGDVGPPDELMRRSSDLTEAVLTRMLPDASLEQFLRVSRRADELILQGLDDTQVKGHLFDEVDNLLADKEK